MELSHINENGLPEMVDVSDKAITYREADAQAVVVMNPETMKKILNNELKKGNVISVAKIAGVMAAKQTSSLIPLCHQIPLISVKIDFSHLSADKLRITSKVNCKYYTGVEMEALTAVSIAALTIYDMCKAIDHGMRVEDVYLLKKSGGRSGEFFHSSIKKIFLKTQKGGNKLCIAECMLDEEGIDGFTKGDKAVSLLDINAFFSIENNNESFCARKFYANFITEGLDYSELKIGTRINVGDGVIEITQVGKQCFEECDLLISNKPCLLRNNCAFAKIIKIGKVKIGSAISINDM